MTVADETLPQPGELLLNRYRVERVIGEGGMGVVLEVREGDSAYAMKVLKPKHVSSSRAAQRMLREANAVAALGNPHVPRVHTAGLLDSGMAYLVMDLLAGCTLQERLCDEGTLGVQRAADIAIQVCAALAEAHAAGMVHRDIKPSNLMLDDDGWVRLLDFGIVKLHTEAGGGSLTETGSKMGSPRYMSPEQLRDAKGVDARSDVWSLGVVLYEMVAGRPPFEAATQEALCLAIGIDDPAPLEDVDPALAAVIRRCLAKSRLERYVNVAALAEALAPFASDDGRRRAAAVAATMQLDDLGETLDPHIDAGPSSNSTPRGWRGWWLGVAATAAVGGVAAWQFAGPTDTMSSPASSAATRSHPSDTTSASPTISSPPISMPLISSVASSSSSAASTAVAPLKPRPLSSAALQAAAPRPPPKTAPETRPEEPSSRPPTLAVAPSPVPREPTADASARRQDPLDDRR